MEAKNVGSFAGVFRRNKFMKTFSFVRMTKKDLKMLSWTKEKGHGKRFRYPRANFEFGGSDFGQSCKKKKDQAPFLERRKLTVHFPSNEPEHFLTNGFYSIKKKKKKCRVYENVYFYFYAIFFFNTDQLTRVKFKTIKLIDVKTFFC